MSLRNTIVPSKLKDLLTPEKVSDTIEKCYDWSLTGLPTSKSCIDLAEYYLKKYPSKEIAAKQFIKNQLSKCFTSGFALSFGGIFETFITLPANITSVLYIQLRMIATLAMIGGYDPHNEEVETLALLCMFGTGIADACKGVGIKIGEKTTEALIKKIPVKALYAINRKLGFRFVTKAGETGVVKLVGAIPIVGGAVNGGIDYADTNIIANKAYKMFILGIID